MTQALPTRAEIEQLILAARRELVECEDAHDEIGADLARARCDSLLDRWAHVPEQRPCD